MLQYRVEHTAYKSDRNPIDVMTFESTELDNDDTIEYIRDHYLVNNALLTKNANNLLHNYHDNNDYRLFFTNALDYITKTTRKTITHIIWLTNENIARHQYAAWHNSTEMDAYDVTNAIILSDLDNDGRLYGFENEPKPTQTIQL